jgi:phosphatidylserine decarboxylase
MRIPLAPAGRREMVIITLSFGGLAFLALLLAIAGHSWSWPVAALFAIVWAGGLAFFRDPERTSPTGQGLLLAPADGTIVEAAKLDRYDDIGGPATRISIFLSVFSVHINRAPCSGVVRAVRYVPGKFMDARRPECGTVNEANNIIIDPDAPLDGPIVVRQISGAIARRIVCDVKPGDRIEAGQRIGMIKFGSRTEMIVPGHDLYMPAVEIGQGSVGAVTILARKTSPKAAQGPVVAQTEGSK